jgi:WD40 repeat protein
LIGAATIRGVCVWDLVTGKVAGLYPFDNSRGGVAYDPGGRQIITNGPLGLHVWPVGWTEEPDRMEYWFGMPQALPLPSDFNRGPVAVSRNARLLATGMRNDPGTVFVTDLDSREIVRTFSGHSNLYFVDLSPDGRWIATGTQHGRDVKVWETATGNVVTTIPCGSANVAFSPTGRTLVVAGGQEYSIYKTDAWTCWRRLRRDNVGDLAGFVAFDAEGELIAYTSGLRSVTLARASDLHPLATFSAPDSAIISSLTLSDNGSHLVAGMENGLVHVWNLRLIRAELAKLNLDWDQPLLAAPPAAWWKDSVRIRTRLSDKLQLSIPNF